MIHIVPGAAPGELAKFVPQLQVPGPNGEAIAVAGDRINWFNLTTEIYQPEAVTDDTFQTPMKNAAPGEQFYLSEPIPSNKPSLSGWLAVAPEGGDTLYYRCARHPGVHGRIKVT